MPGAADVIDSLHILQDAHDKYLDDLMCPESDNSSIGDGFSVSARRGLVGMPTPPTSGKSRSVQSLSVKPQFNLDSAEKLLQSFRGMLAFFPCYVLPDDATVASLARRSPFVLLAILASASASRTLQCHTLYDEEFRKVLALKFVAGGERSLELLQGITIYCAW
jgi:hypothetical protein